jgi:hypothetical protein
VRVKAALLCAVLALHGCAALEAPWITLAHGRLPDTGCVLYPSGEVKWGGGRDAANSVKVNFQCAMGTGLPDQK